VSPVTSASIHTAYYGVCPPGWWIESIVVEPPGLVVLDHKTGRRYLVPWQISGDAVVFGLPQLQTPIPAPAVTGATQQEWGWAEWAEAYAVTGCRAYLDRALRCHLPEAAEQTRVTMMRWPPAGDSWLRTAPGGLDKAGPAGLGWVKLRSASLRPAARALLLVLSAWLIAGLLWGGLSTGQWGLVTLGAAYLYALSHWLRRRRR
jgi:hypothetical protein